jgi:hypothetical protein
MMLASGANVTHGVQPTVREVRHIDLDCVFVADTFARYLREYEIARAGPRQNESGTALYLLSLYNQNVAFVDSYCAILPASTVPPQSRASVGKTGGSQKPT